MVDHYLTAFKFRLMMCLYISTISTLVIKFPTSVMADQQLTKLMTRILRLLPIAVLILVGSRLEAKPAELVFTYWGSPFERQAVKKVIQQFNRQHANIRVRAQHIPNSNYATKLLTMVAAGTAPDVAYIPDAMISKLASAGRLMDLSDYFQHDSEASNRMPQIYYKLQDQIIGTSAAIETIILYYNKQVFDQAGLAYPPATAEEAWSWQEFVAICQKLTTDRHGYDATNPNFDAEHITTYGVAFPQAELFTLPFIYSNGGQVASDDGQKLLLNQPEAVEALRKMQDLIYRYHVAPTPSTLESMPSSSFMLQTGKVAMDITGHWQILDLSQMGFDWGMGVLPYFKQPITIICGAPLGIFTSSKHPEEAFQLFKALGDTASNDLFGNGLWMPLHVEDYTDPTRVSQWLNSKPGVYPAEARSVLVDYTINYTPRQIPMYWLRNYGQMLDEAITPALSLMWAGEANAQQAMDQAVKEGQKLLQGRLFKK